MILLPHPTRSRASSRSASPATGDVPMRWLPIHCACPTGPAAWPKARSAARVSIRAVETPHGHAELRFAADNEFGVLDHWVTPEGVDTIYLPFRVIATGADTCEFQFTLLRQPHMDDAAFEADGATIASDLQALRSLLEAS